MAGVHHVQGAVGDGLDRVVHGGARARRHEVLRLAVQLEALVDLHDVVPHALDVVVKVYYVRGLRFPEENRINLSPFLYISFNFK